jgi:arylsulfatase A-like enzyme
MAGMTLRRLTASWAVILILATAFSLACKKNSLPEGHFYRLIDVLGGKNVVKSPLLENEAGLQETDYPVHSSLLADRGAGDNPLGLKRKLGLGNAESNILFAPAESAYQFDIVLPENGVFDFGIGIVRDQNSESMKNRKTETEGSVDFIVSLERQGIKKPIYESRLKMPPLRKERTVNFSQNRVRLPAKPGKARITLRTAGDTGIFSFWSNPVIYEPGRKRTNVILVSVDTLRADHLGMYGYNRDTSPATDALAKDGAVFLNAYAQSPWTLPSHVSMLTGLNGIRHRVYTKDEKIDPAVPTLADFMRERAYFCSAITGGAFLSAAFGFSKGFDTYEIRGNDFTHLNLAEECFGGVSRWLSANADKNFFLFVHTYQTHSPYASPLPYNAMFLGEHPKRTAFDVLKDLGGEWGVFKKLPDEDRQNIIGLYDGEIRYTDEHLVKPLVEALHRLGLYDRTMIVLTSDHGEQFYEHGSWNHGNLLYNDVLKVPLIIKFPESAYRGLKVSNIVRLIDILPTILDSAGILPRNPDLDGRSLLPILSGKEKEDRAFLSDYSYDPLENPDSAMPPRVATNAGRWKFIMNKPWPQKYLDALISPPPHLPPLELYDLESDPLERQNMAEKMPELVGRLRDELRALYKDAAGRKGQRSTMSKELQDQLKALGYIR